MVLHRTLAAFASLVLSCSICDAQEIRLNVDFTTPLGTWNMPALALGQGGLQSDPMILPHVKEIRELRPRTIRLFLSEYYRIYPDHDVYDFSKLDRELEAVRKTGARPTLALAMKPPVLFRVVDHFKVHPNNYEEWEALCEALARHCRDKEYQVAAWEVCNEPDIGESGGTPQYFTKPEDYNTFYDHTVKGVRRGDPEAVVGGPAVADADSMLVEGLIKHCAETKVPFDFLSWHLYSDSAEHHASNIEKQRRRLAKFPELKEVKLFISEWNMDLASPDLHPGFQPAFILETMRRFAEAGLDMAAYYHIRDCFVDRADFDWMSPSGIRFMAHWWNTMPQYSALFDHHGRVRPSWYAFRILSRFDGPRYPVEGERDSIRAIAGDNDGYKHILIWRYEGNGPDEVDVRVSLNGLGSRFTRIVELDAASPVNNIKVIKTVKADQLGDVSIKLKPWAIRWIEVE